MESNTIKKFFAKPGLCTQAELDITKKFLEDYKGFRDVYRSATFTDPTNLTLESNLETMDWYQNNPTVGKSNDQ
ncbi:MAG: hypothetical protein KAS32_15780 [Candidatus Peribacteraceae bacterium]|nr:hypothetical protein [Candidatus Peribacteraceae bacterium]